MEKCLWTPDHLTNMKECERVQWAAEFVLLQHWSFSACFDLHLGHKAVSDFFQAEYAEGNRGTVLQQARRVPHQQRLSENRLIN